MSWSVQVNRLFKEFHSCYKSTTELNNTSLLCLKSIPVEQNLCDGE